MQIFGLFLMTILEEKGITIYSLSKKTGISSSQLYRIRDGTSEPSPYILWELSKVVGINLDMYYRTFYDFGTLEEYKFFIECRQLIENGFDIDKLEKLHKELKKCKIKNDKSLYKQLEYYLEALILSGKYKNYKKSNEVCFSALGIKEIVFSVDRIRHKYLKSEFSYNIMHLIEANYFNLGEYEKAFNICERIIEEIELMYYNENIPKFYVPTTVFRAYIAIINNKADLLFILKKYEESLLVCDYGIKILNENNSIYLMSQLCELKFQNFYGLDNIVLAKEFFIKAKVVCEVSGDIEHLERIIKRAELKYKNIF